ncbi:MAG: DHH family phosphoesterase [Acidilobus sp.]
MAYLARGKRVVIATHGNADLDAVASGLLLCETLKANSVSSCCLMIPDGPNKGVRDVVAQLGIDLPICYSEGYEVVVVVDASNWSQIRCEEECYGRLALLDHHEPGSLSMASSVRYVDTNSPTCTELAVEVMEAAGVRPPSPLATLALTAILDETSLFERSSYRTFLAVVDLLAAGGDYERAVGMLRRSRSDEAADLRIARLKAASRLRISRACADLIVTSTYVGSYEAEVARTLVSLGADVAIAFKENRASIRVSKRALGRGVSASDLASYLASKLGGEGGGHKGAAALNLPTEVDEEKAASRALELTVSYIGRVCGGTGGVRGA